MSTAATVSLSSPCLMLLRSDTLFIISLRGNVRTTEGDTEKGAGGEKEVESQEMSEDGEWTLCILQEEEKI